MSNKRFFRRGFALRFLLIFPSILALLTLIVMLLWNAVLSPALDVGTLTYWQAGGLLILCRILFGGFGGGGWKKPGQWRGGPPSERRGFKDMTPEERDRIRVEWKKRCAQRKQP